MIGFQASLNISSLHVQQLLADEGDRGENGWWGTVVEMKENVSLEETKSSSFVLKMAKPYLSHLPKFCFAFWETFYINPLKTINSYAWWTMSTVSQYSLFTMVNNAYWQTILLDCPYSLFTMVINEDWTTICIVYLAQKLMVFFRII